MKLVYIADSRYYEGFKMSCQHAVRHEVPKEFIELYQDEMQEYELLEKQVRELTLKKTILLKKLKGNFDEEFRETNPEYFL